MAYHVKKNAKIALKEEVTPGVYVPPTSTDYVKVEGDPIDFKKEYEQLEQDFIGSGLGSSPVIKGLDTNTGSITFPLTTGSTEGSKAPISLPLKSALGVEKIIAELELDSGSTTTNLVFTGSHGLEKHDQVLVKVAGAYEVRVVTAVVDSDEVTISPALSGAPAAGVKIAASRQYRPAETGHVSFSIEHTLADGSDALKTKIRGSRISEVSFNDISSGKLASMAINIMALGISKENAAASATPSYSQAQRTGVKEVYIIQGSNVIKVNDFGLSIANDLVMAKNVKDGNESIALIKRTVTGSFNPYKQLGAGGLTQWAKFEADEAFSMLVVLKNPNGTDGEGKNYVSFWLPNCQITTFEDGDVDGLLTDGLEFQANVISGSDEIHIMIS